MGPGPDSQGQPSRPPPSRCTPPADESDPHPAKAPAPRRGRHPLKRGGPSFQQAARPAPLVPQATTIRAPVSLTPVRTEQWSREQVFVSPLPALPLYDKVKVRQTRNIHPHAVPKLVAVKDPCFDGELRLHRGCVPPVRPRGGSTAACVSATGSASTTANIPSTSSPPATDWSLSITTTERHPTKTSDSSRTPRTRPGWRPAREAGPSPQVRTVRREVHRQHLPTLDDGEPDR